MRAEIVSKPDIDMYKMDKWRAWNILWHGAVAGCVGTLLLFFYLAYRNPYLVWFGLFVPLIGPVIGVVIALIILTFSFVFERNVHIGLRACIGGGLILILAWCVGLVTNPPNFVVGSDRLWLILDDAVIILLAGVVPGIFAKHRKPKVRQ